MIEFSNINKRGAGMHTQFFPSKDDLEKNQNEIKYLTPYATYLSTHTDVATMLKKINEVLTTFPDILLNLKRNNSITLSARMTKSELENELKTDGIDPLPTVEGETPTLTNLLLSLDTTPTKSAKTTYTQLDAHRDYDGATLIRTCKVNYYKRCLSRKLSLQFSSCSQ
jgi:hypothetical protein